MRPRLHLLLVASSLALLACGSAKQEFPLAPTAIVPAAKGTVETRRTENQNTEVKVEVDHLAPPHRVATGATTYVVWTQPLAPGARPQNVGALAVDGDRSGSLETKTPFDKFELFVTPEPSPNATEPSNQPVMKAKVAR